MNALIDLWLELATTHGLLGFLAPFYFVASAFIAGVVLEHLYWRAHR